MLHSYRVEYVVNVFNIFEMIIQEPVADKIVTSTIISHQAEIIETPPVEIVETPSVENDYKLDISSLVKYIVSAFIVILLFHAAVILLKLAGINNYSLEKFYFDREDSLPTYFSTIILFIAGVLLSLITLMKKQAKNRYVKQWLILSLTFILLSIDEAAAFHEMLDEPLRQKFHLSGVLNFPWTLAGILAVCCFVTYFFKFLLSLPADSRWEFIVAGFIYLLGAIGFEMIGGFLYSDAAYGKGSHMYMLSITIEESFEYLGVILFIAALIKYIRKYISTEVRIRF